MSDNKAIINYLKQLIDEQDRQIEWNLKEIPEDKNDNTFCYECGYHTEDVNYHEKYIKNYLLDELEKLTKEVK